MATAYKQPQASGPESRRGMDDDSKLLEAARPIIGRLSLLADEQVRQKRQIEARWIEDLQNYFGRYDQDTLEGLKEEERSTAFVKLTRHKTNSWAARIADILFPTDDRNWGIKPTPLPELVDKAKEAMKKAEAAVDSANAAQDPEQQDRIKEIADSFAQAARLTQQEIEEAKKRCDRMEKTIEDQLVQSDYVAESRDAIEDGCRLGTAILKGPLTAQRLRSQWRETEGGWQLVSIPDPMPEFRRVDPWHFFPDMSAGRIRDAEFTFERHLPTKRDLKRFARKLGFNVEAVKRIIEEGPRPLGLEVDHLATLRTITGEGEAVKDRFVMWEFHGALECDEVADLLRATGQHEKAERFEEEKDPLSDHRVIIHFCNNEVLKIAPEYPLDSGDSLYSVWNFEKGETSLFGYGVPNIMGDSQRALNSAWRMMMDNAALSVGPQVLINQNAIVSQDGNRSLKPLKVWLLSSTAGIGPNVPAFSTFDIPIKTDQLMAIIELAKAFIDEETGMPTIAQGEQGASTKTLGGMSMLFNSANVVFRRIVKAWDDDLTKPTIRRAYDWNMQFNPDDEIKGDMQVDARGSSVLLVREIQSQSLMQIMTNWTTHPRIAPWIKVREGLVKTIQTMMISPDDILQTQDEFDRIVAKEQEAASQEGEGEQDPALAIAQLRADAEMQRIERRTQSDERIAQMRYDVEMARLQKETGLSETEIRAKYDIEDKNIRSRERMKAVDVGVEERRARRAAAKGESESVAVGKGVG